MLNTFYSKISLSKALGYSWLGALSLVASAHLALANWDINPNDLPEIRRVAFQLQADASEATQEASRYASYGSPQEQEGVRALQSLSDASSALARDLGGGWIDASRMDTDYFGVEQTENRVQYSRGALRANAYNPVLFDRLAAAVAELRQLRSGEYSPGPTYPGSGEINQIRAIAYSLSANTQELLRRAGSEGNFNQPWKQNAIRDIEILSEQINRLSSLAQSSWDPGYSRGELTQVLAAYDRVRQTVPNARFSNSILEALAQVSRGIADLSRAYDGYAPIAPSGRPIVVVPGGGPVIRR
jgi:hypothetical protein